MPERKRFFSVDLFPIKESLPEGIGIDLAVHLEGLEGSKDDIVVIGASGHLGGEEGDHLSEVHGPINLVKHGLEKY